VPYSQVKTRGAKDAPQLWTRAIVDQTRNLPKVKEACTLRVTFFLPPNKFPTDLPYGSDLDNLLKRFLDALGKTVFSEAKGGDSCVVSLSVMKTKASSEDQSGAWFEILPVSLTDHKD